MRNWKTTILGILAGAIPILHTGVQAASEGQQVDWWQVAFGMGIMALGSYSKDYNASK